VRWAKSDLDFPLHVSWLGKSGAHLCDLDALLEGISGPTPSIIIVHIGTNDLVDVDEFSIRQRIVLSMKKCVKFFPHTTIIWSDILPRLFYFGARSQLSLERKRRALNRWARSQGRRLGVSILHHPQFKWTETALYRFDGVHLSPTGNQVFLGNFRCAIRSLL
jgi:lysophospholipase L1-like esterase